MDLGGIAVRNRVGSRQPGGGPVRGTVGTVRVPGLAGRGEGLRRSHDETAGAKPGTSPVDRKAVGRVRPYRVRFTGRRSGVVGCCEQCGCEFPGGVFEFVGFFDDQGQADSREDTRYPVEALGSQAHPHPLFVDHFDGREPGR